MIPTMRWLAVLGLVSVGACAPVGVTAPEPVAAPTDAQVRAQAAMAAFSGRLRSELGEAMQRGGPLGAVDFCHVQAPRIADQVMAEHGVRLGRVAVPGRNRKAANIAAGWQAAALGDFQAQVDAGGAPEAQVRVMRDGLPDGVELRIARGIRVEPACLLCHGTAVAPELAARIAQHYPDDRATGFTEGQLRGAIWAEVSRGPAVEP